MLQIPKSLYFHYEVDLIFIVFLTRTFDKETGIIILAVAIVHRIPNQMRQKKKKKLPPNRDSVSLHMQTAKDSMRVQGNFRPFAFNEYIVNYISRPTL